MGIREKVNQNPGVVIGAAIAVIVIAVVLLVLQMGGGSGAAEVGAGTAKLFFTTDDGKTWFLDESKNIPPFTKDGKDAVRAHVYRASDGTEFVGFLERYSPAGKKMLEASLARPIEEQALDDPFMAAAGTIQWKKPGDATWVGASDPKAEQVMKVVSPKGPGNAVSPVAPTQ